MGRPLDILVVQSHPNAARDAKAELRKAGHRVHSCYAPGSRGFPCKGLEEPDGCPLDRGVNVALLVRSRVLPRPTALENGVICVIRAGIPLVEQGSPTLDPFDPWIALRLSNQDAVTEGCETAMSQGDEPLRLEILDRVVRLLQRAALPTDSVACSLEHTGTGLLVRLSGPDIDRRLQQALALHVLTAVQSAGRPADPLDVSYTILAMAQ